MGAFIKEGIKRKQESISWVIGALEKHASERIKTIHKQMTIEE
ncbi:MULTISPECIES: hypothetical protein [unclassified Oceanobacillus]|nr:MULTISPECIES: hypothetical protein [unclassified Oceanobacillus]